MHYHYYLWFEPISTKRLNVKSDYTSWLSDESLHSLAVFLICIFVALFHVALSLSLRLSLSLSTSPPPLSSSLSYFCTKFIEITIISNWSLRFDYGQLNAIECAFCLYDGSVLKAEVLIWFRVNFVNNRILIITWSWNRISKSDCSRVRHGFTMKRILMHIANKNEKIMIIKGPKLFTLEKKWKKNILCRKFKFCFISSFFFSLFHIICDAHTNFQWKEEMRKLLWMGV